MEALLEKVVGAVNTVLWDYLLIYALVGIGLFFTIYLGAPQVTRFFKAFSTVFGVLSSKDRKSVV